MRIPRLDLVCLFLLFSSSFYSGLLQNSLIREQQLFVLLLGVVIFAAVHHFNKIIGYGLLYCAAHLALFQEAGYVNSMCQVMAHALIYHFIASHYKGNKYPWALLAVLIVNVILGALQILKQDIYLQLDLQPAGLLTLPVYIGIYAAIAAPILFRIHPLTLIPVLIGLWFSRSSFSFGAFAIAMTFYFWKTKSKLLIPFLIAGLIGGAAYAGFYDAPSGEWGRRIKIWQMIGSRIAVNPWGGYGLGSYNSRIRFCELRGFDKEEYFNFRVVPENEEAVFKKLRNFAAELYGETEAKKFDTVTNMADARSWLLERGTSLNAWQDPHNEYLLAWFELGLPFLLLIFWYLYDLYKRFRIPSLESISLMASAISIAVVSVAHFPFGVARISFLCTAILAILDRKLSITGNRKGVTA